MKSRNPAFENNLAYLQHPVTLLSIAVLLLNDHVLKIISPSWLTGKLSDFAGLFFFPFIVAAGLSLLLSKFNLSRERIGQIAFGIVAIWFTLLKTSPLVNSLTAQIASLFVGGPTRLIMDWTDLMALAILWPAWNLWRAPKSFVRGQFAYAILLVAILASLASSPREWKISSVTQVEFKDGVLFAGDSDWGPFSYPVARSEDGGQTWKMDAERTRISGNKYPHQVCGAINSKICYRIEGLNGISESTDGGETWSVLSDVNNRVYDIVIFEWNGEEYVVIAMGMQGVMRRSLPDGDWEKIEVNPTGLL